MIIDERLRMIIEVDGLEHHGVYRAPDVFWMTWFSPFGLSGVRLDVITGKTRALITTSIPLPTDPTSVELSTRVNIGQGAWFVATGGHPMEEVPMPPKKKRRWTKEEDAFLRERKKDGLSNLEIVSAYHKAFPDSERPSGGVHARIPSYWTAHGLQPPGGQPERPPEIPQRSVVSAATEVFGILEPLEPGERKRILRAAVLLFGDILEEEG